jgi:hypothetical protein
LGGISEEVLSSREDAKVLVFLVMAMLFFVVTLLVSFFVIIYLIYKEGVSPDYGPDLFMAGLIPPSMATILLYVKVFGRHLFSKPDRPV